MPTNANLKNTNARKTLKYHSSTARANVASWMANDTNLENKFDLESVNYVLVPMVTGIVKTLIV